MDNEELLDYCINAVGTIREHFKDMLGELEGLQIPARLHSKIAAFQSQEKILDSTAEKALNLDSMFSTFSGFGAVGANLGRELRNENYGLSGRVKELASLILSKSREMRESIALRPVHLDSLGEGAVSNFALNFKGGIDKEGFWNEAQVKLKAIMEEQERHNSRHQKLLAGNQSRINDLEVALGGLQENVAREVKAANDLYEAAKIELKEQRSEVARLIGVVTGEAVAGSFEESAKGERQLADIMRWASIGCMAVAILFIAASLWSSLAREFDWQASIFRGLMAFLLTVPSAYLARESAKHRNLHNKHLQTSLELRAINPYLASLPIEEQHRIKSDVAARLFGGGEAGGGGVDSYPINAQEIIMEILKKVDFKGKN